MRILFFLLTLSCFSCESNTKKLKISDKLKGKYICKDTGQISYGWGTYFETLEFKNGTYEYIIFDYDNIISTSGRYFTFENKIKGNEILALVPFPSVHNSKDTFFDGLLYYEIVDLNDSALFLRNPSDWQKKRIKSIRKYEHKIEVFKLVSK